MQTKEQIIRSLDWLPYIDNGNALDDMNKDIITISDRNDETLDCLCVIDKNIHYANIGINTGLDGLQTTVKDYFRRTDDYVVCITVNHFRYAEPVFLMIFRGKVSEYDIFDIGVNNVVNIYNKSEIKFNKRSISCILNVKDIIIIDIPEYVNMDDIISTLTAQIIM